MPAVTAWIGPPRFPLFFLTVPRTSGPRCRLGLTLRDGLLLCFSSACSVSRRYWKTCQCTVLLRTPATSPRRKVLDEVVVELVPVSSRSRSVKRPTCHETPSSNQRPWNSVRPPRGVLRAESSRTVSSTNRVPTHPTLVKSASMLRPSASNSLAHATQLSPFLGARPLRAFPRSSTTGTKAI